MRRIAKLLGGIIVILAIAWLGLWWYAQGREAQGLQALATQWSQPHHFSDGGSLQFSYNGISRGTNPLAATATLQNPRWSVQIPGVPGPITLSLPGATLRIAVTDPLALHLDLPKQIDLTSSRATAAVTFGASDIRYQLIPQALFRPGTYPNFSQADASFSDINVLASNGSLQLLHIDDLAEHVTLAPSAGKTQTAVAVTDKLDGLTLPAWLVQAARIPFNGQIAHADFALEIAGPLDFQAYYDQLVRITDPRERLHFIMETLHQWAAAGGHAKAGLTLAIGPSTLRAKGDVAFDANVQPSGQFDLTADQLDQFTNALTSAYPDIAQDVNYAEALLSPYLSTTQASGQTLTLHGSYGNGAVTINGQKVSDMKPLDWNHVLNTDQPTAPPAPAPAPAQAPGDGSGAATPATAPAPAAPAAPAPAPAAKQG